MHNGVGLSTPRGSGTSGYVQRNFASVPRKPEKLTEDCSSELTVKKINEEILEREKKRKIEIECIELSDKLESQGYTQEEIDNKVDSYRTLKLEAYENSRKHEE